MACAGVEAAVYNVKVNLPSIKDQAFRDEMEAELATLLSDARALRDEVSGYVLEKIR